MRTDHVANRQSTDPTSKPKRLQRKPSQRLIKSRKTGVLENFFQSQCPSVNASSSQFHPQRTHKDISICYINTSTQPKLIKMKTLTDKVNERQLSQTISYPSTISNLNKKFLRSAQMSEQLDKSSGICSNQVQKYKEENKCLKKQILKLEERVRCLKEENDFYCQKFVTLSSSIEQIQTIKSQLQKDLREKDNEVKRLQQKHMDERNLEKHCGILDQMIKKIRCEYEEQYKLAYDLKKKNARYLKQIHNLKQKNTHKNRKKTEPGFIGEHILNKQNVFNQEAAYQTPTKTVYSIQSEISLELSPQ